MRYEEYFMTASATRDVSKLPCMENLIPLGKTTLMQESPMLI